MIDISLALLEQLVVHKIGNLHNEEGTFLSENSAEATDDLKDVLSSFFLSPFGQNLDTFRFVHNIDIQYHVLGGLCSIIFENPEKLADVSKDIAGHLYDQSSHPHIKAGDLFVVFFENIVVGGEVSSAIGLFKSERKDNFLKLSQEETAIKLAKEEGISLKRVDKGALILNTEKADGYRVFSIDNNRYDAQYWKTNFLGIDFIKDDNYDTKNCMNLMTAFANEVVKTHEGKKGQIDFLNETVKFMADKDKLDLKEYSEKLLPDESWKKEFNSFKDKFEEKNDIEISGSFNISKPVLSKEKKKIKNNIKLDTRIEIRLNFDSTESLHNLVKQGFDAEKGMHYYKLYYNKETN